MTESLNGLRFDIYERVHLPEDAGAIEELEEIELVPHIQAIPREDHVLLKGHLQLTGSYRSLDEQSSVSRLEHRIPVEISLPPSRVEKLEDLSVEIDNFDVDLLSSRSLNVTGVLGLRGVQISSSSSPAPVWQEDGFTVVHQAKPNDYPASSEGPAEGNERPAESGQAFGGAETRPFEEPYSPAKAEYGYLSPYESSSEIRPSQPAAPYPQAAPGQPQAPSQPIPPWQSFSPSQAFQTPQALPPSEPYSPYPTAPAYPGKPAQPPAASAPQAYASSPAANEAYRDLREEEPPAADLAPGNESSQASPPGSAWSQPGQASYRPPEPEEEPAQSSDSEFNQLNGDYADASWGDVTIEQLEIVREQPQSEDPSPQEISQQEISQQEPPSPAADKTEVKVGFGSKQSSDLKASSPAFGVGLLSQLGEKGGRREAEEEAAEAGADKEASAAPSRETSGDEIEWTRLFLSKEAEGQSFRKVKLCIVQREDTLEAIATRYNVQSRELQLYNRLTDPHVSEGQIIYIP